MEMIRRYTYKNVSPKYILPFIYNQTLLIAKAFFLLQLFSDLAFSNASKLSNNPLFNSYQFNLHPLTTLNSLLIPIDSIDAMVKHLTEFYEEYESERYLSLRSKKILSIKDTYELLEEEQTQNLLLQELAYGQFPDEDQEDGEWVTTETQQILKQGQVFYYTEQAGDESEDNSQENGPVLSQNSNNYQNLNYFTQNQGPTLNQGRNQSSFQQNLGQGHKGPMKWP